MSDSELRSGLAGLSSGLAADGYRLDARWSPDGRVQLTIDATAEACADCLVPPDIMRGIAVAMLRDSGVHLNPQDIDVTYPASDGDH